MINDYIGRYVKQFESGTRGSLSLSSCGNDWGVSCGSYQLTLRWGKCISFLKKYFPQEAKSLYFNAQKDIAVQSYPGPAYCSSPDMVKSVWVKCYNKVGADVFFSYEYEHIKNTYYDKIKEKIKSYLDLDKADRGFQECFWSWAVHKGVNGCYSAFMQVITENNITALDYINKEDFFNLLYDKRYSIDKFNRYKKSTILKNNEREILLPMIGKGTFSGKTEPVKEPIKPKKVLPLKGTLKVIYKGSDGLNVRELASFDSDVKMVYNYGKIVDVTGITEDSSMYQLSNNLFITANTKYVLFTKEAVKDYLYRVRISVPELPIHKSASEESRMTGNVHANQVFTIVQEKNDWGRLKSNAGWIYMKGTTKKC